MPFTNRHVCESFVRTPVVEERSHRRPSRGGLGPRRFTPCHPGPRVVSAVLPTRAGHGQRTRAAVFQLYAVVGAVGGSVEEKYIRSSSHLDLSENLQAKHVCV
jgi:hypothetical protein